MTVCKEHEWGEMGWTAIYNPSERGEEIESTAEIRCLKCGAKPPIDFKIKENLEIINKQQWEDIWKEYQKSEKGQSFFYSFYDWLRENYLAPEKKNT